MDECHFHRMTDECARAHGTVPDAFLCGSVINLNLLARVGRIGDHVDGSWLFVA